MEEEAEECSSMLTGEEIPPTHDSRPPDSEGELGVAGSGGGDAASSTNVIVDDSPLQNQMQKNKECKLDHCIAISSSCEIESIISREQIDEKDTLYYCVNFAAKKDQDNSTFLSC